MSTAVASAGSSSSSSWRTSGSRRPKPNQPEGGAAAAASASASSDVKNRGAARAAARDPALEEFERERAQWHAAAAKGQTPAGGALTRESVQEYAAKLEDENEATLDRALGEAQAATETGAATLAKLDSQEKQLRKIDSDLKDMNATMSRSERILSGMKSWTASLWNSISGPKKAADTSFEGSGAAAAAAQRNAAAAAAAADAKTSPSAAAGARIDPTPRPVRLAAKAGKESRVDEQLDQLSELVGVLGQQAKDMNRVITETGDLVDHIDTVVTSTGVRVKKATRTTEKIIRDN